MLLICPLGIMVLKQTSRSRFKQSNIALLGIPHMYVLGCFVNFLVILGVYLGINNFLKGLVNKLMEIGNLEDLNLVDIHQTEFSTSLRCPFGGNQLSGAVPKRFSLLLILKFHLHSDRNPT